MRWLVLVAALVAMAVPAAAARRLTVAQLEQTLRSEIEAHHTDADLAHKVGDLEMAERLTEATLDRFAGMLAMGPRTALALQLLADQSAFLDPPSSELPATEAPDAATQQQMMDAARGYVVQILPHLPNFFATRSTNRFDDGPQILKQGDWPVRAGLHLAGTVSRQITFRDGREVADPAAEPAAGSANQAEQGIGLRTFGEFGPEMSIVLADAAKGQVSWSHWEQTPAGLAAVFRYEVPRAVSHYAVNYCCLRNEEFLERRDLTYRSRDQTPQQMANLPKTAALQPFRDTPGYHGALFIDPATGAILRITLEAELKQSDPITRASTVVEYGPVKIGGQSYICPVRSLAFSMKPAVYKANGEPASPATLLVNETTFTNYHRLGATMRMLADTSGAGGDNEPQPNAGTQSATAAGASQDASVQPASVAPASASAPEAGTQAGANAPPPTSVAAEAAPAITPPAPPPAPVIPEVTLSAANGLPDQPADAADAQDADVTLKVTSRLVDVGVIVYDKKGHPVKDLKQEDFEVYDNGRKQEVRFFSEFTGVTPAAQATPAASVPEQSYSNRSPDPAGLATPGQSGEETATILLIDESHIAWNDMNNARQQVLKFLKEAAPGERLGLYAMTSLGFKVLEEITTDHAALIARLQKWMPTAQSVSQAQDEEMRNRQQINEVHNVADLNSVNGNLNDVPDANQPVDPQLPRTVHRVTS